MKLGWCSPLEEADLIKETGYDFIEVPLAPLGLEDRATFAASRRAVLNSPLPTLAFNVLFPRDFKVVGPSVDVHRIRNYLARAAELLADAQAHVIVFGSGWARNIPENWSRPRGEDQFLQTLSWCAGPLSRARGLRSLSSLSIGKKQTSSTAWRRELATRGRSTGLKSGYWQISIIWMRSRSRLRRCAPMASGLFIFTSRIPVEKIQGLGLPI